MSLPKHAGMPYEKDTVLTVDYHKKNLEIRQLHRATGEERTFRRPTTRAAIEAVLQDAVAEAARSGGGVVWIMESTTGWARVKDLLAGRAKFLLCNVLQMPRTPKAHRKKTDKIDTARIQGEYLNGEMPLAYQPTVELRQLRRLTAAREDLVARQTHLRNQVSQYLAHETWESTSGMWSIRGRKRLRTLAAGAGPDGFVLGLKIRELEQLETMLKEVRQQIVHAYAASAMAKKVDQIKGVAPVAAVSILARIGPVERFRSTEALVALAGLAPGVHRSDDTCRNGRIGGAGTDKALRHYLIEATVWARQIPRYRQAYERTVRRRGKKVARIVVGRMLLRSIYKMLKDGVPFDPSARAA